MLILDISEVLLTCTTILMRHNQTNSASIEHSGMLDKMPRLLEEAPLQLLPRIRVPDCSLVLADSSEELATLSLGIKRTRVDIRPLLVSRLETELAMLNKKSYGTDVYLVINQAKQSK